MAKTIAEEYRSSLEDLTFNSKPHINVLTMLADEYQDHADLVVRVIEEKLEKAPPNCKLPIMYLMDSIVKNVGGNYKPLFAKNIVESFLIPFRQGDDKVKMSLYKLRSTWDSHFPLKRLYELDATIHTMDANWPVKPLPASLQEKTPSIHVNPKFLKKGDVSSAPSTPKISTVKTAGHSISDGSDLKQDLINKQKQLLELQQQKLLLELEQTKQQLAMREKKTLQRKEGAAVTRDPRVKQVTVARAAAKTTLTNGDARVPRPKAKATLTDPRKAVSDPTRKAPKKLGPAKPKSLEKKSPAETDKPEKKQKTSKSTGKPAAAKTGKEMPKSPKSGPMRKMVPKKSSGKAPKRTSDENRADDAAKTSVKDSKVKEKVPRRSPLPTQPPARHPKRNTSTERRHSPRRDTNAPRSRFGPESLKNDDRKRFSPMSEGSISPRFSPEPDESTSRREDWGPSNKRPRHHDYPAPPPLAHMMLPSREAPGLRRRTSVDPNLTIPQELTLDHQAEILKQAEIQLRTGQLTHTQHQEFLKQLHQLFELQRMRSTVGPQSRMPLDELLPPQMPPNQFDPREDEFRPRPQFRDGHGLPFRPPPSPPRMEDHTSQPHQLGHRRLTPPPAPPVDPRRDRSHRGGRRERKDFRGPRSRFRGNPNRRPTPPRPARREGMGGVYILDDDDNGHHDRSMHEFNNGTKPQDRVPLRDYADGSKPGDNLARKKGQPLLPLPKPESDHDDEGPHLEEPEDYIIAGIPPGAQAYHEHSMKLKRGNTVTGKVLAGRRVSDAGLSGSQDEDSDRAGQRGQTPPESRRDKQDDAEDLSKSPSLPLKKRKYVVSAEGDVTSEVEIDIVEKVSESSTKQDDKPLHDLKPQSSAGEEIPVVETTDVPVEDTEKQVVLQENVTEDKTAEIVPQGSEEPAPGPKHVDVKTKVSDGKGEKPVVSESVSEPKRMDVKKKRKRAEQRAVRDSRKPPLPDRPPQRRRTPEQDNFRMDEERRISRMMMEEEDRMQWEAHLERELGREDFQPRMGRGMRPSPPRMWGRNEGPWRGRGPPPPPGPPGRRFDRDFWEGELRPPFPGRPPLNRPPPPRRMLEEREWPRWDDRRRGRPSMLRPGHDGPGREWRPRGPRPVSPDRPPPIPFHDVPPLRPEISQLNVNELLSSLVAEGIIPGQGTVNEPEKPQEMPVEAKSAVPTKSVDSPAQSDPPSQEMPSVVEHAAKKLEEKRVPTPVFDNLFTLDPNANMPDVDFKDTEKLKIRHDDVIARLYTGIQCSACGMRFTACQTDMYAEHLDWHYRLNRKDKEGTQDTHRPLYPTAGEIADPSQRETSQVFEEEGEENFEQGPGEEMDEDKLTVPVAQNPEQDKCAVCNEAFTTVYNDEEEEWQYVQCVAVDGKNFHPACYADHDENAPPPPTPIRMPIYNPLSVAVDGIPGLDSLSRNTSDNENEDNHTADESEPLPEKPMSEESQAEPCDTDEIIPPKETGQDESSRKSPQPVTGQQEDEVANDKDDAKDCDPSPENPVDDESVVDDKTKPIGGDEVDIQSATISSTDNHSDISNVSKIVDTPARGNDDSVSVENSVSVDVIGDENAEPVVDNTVSDKQSETGVAECELSDTVATDQGAEVLET